MEYMSLTENFNWLNYCLIIKALDFFGFWDFLKKDSLNYKMFDFNPPELLIWHKCCQTLHTFKTQYVREFDFQITGNNLQNRRNFLTSANYLIMTANRHSVFHNTCIIYFIYVYKIWYCQCPSDIFSRIVNRLSNSWRSSFDRTSFMLTLLHNKFQNKKTLQIYSNYLQISYNIFF